MRINQFVVYQVKDGAEYREIRFRKYLPKNFPGHSISTSDVYVINRDGVASAFYVDGEKLIVLAGFLRLNSSGVLISMDTTGYRMEGKRRKLGSL